MADQGPRTAEHRRLRSEPSPEHEGPAPDDWYQWGPYLAERAWGSVREDYSESGDAWSSFPHDHARSRAYRWNEDGLAGLCDVGQRLCLALSLWNGRDPILKERIFGLTGPEGNHGEDAKEYWWYLDGAARATPGSAGATTTRRTPFPYELLVAENGRRGFHDPEFELLDTGVFDQDRYWSVEVTYAKASPTDILMRINVENHGPTAEELHVLPTLWFRNTWSWDGDDASTDRRCACDGGRDPGRPRTTPAPTSCVAGDGPDGPPVGAVLRERDQRAAAVRDGGRRRRTRRTGSTTTSCPGRPRSNPDRHGHEGGVVVPDDRPRRRVRPSCGCACAGSTPQRTATRRVSSGVGRRRVLARRRSTTTVMTDRDAGGRRVLRRAPAAGHRSRRRQGRPPGERRAGVEQAVLPVSAWPAGSTATRVSPRHRRRAQTGRNAGWRHLDADDILAMPDPWEYPWFAAWDLAFHAIAWTHLDPAFAKYQVLVLLREWFLNPNGALPAYEWSFDDVNPPVHAFAALRVFLVDGGDGLRLPRAGLPQAAAQLHVVAQPAGPRRQQPLRRRLPRARQHQPDRPLAPSAGGDAGAGRRLGVDGLQHAWRCWASPRCSPSRTRSTTISWSPSSSGS